MFGLSYLSADNKYLLEKLQNRLTRTTDLRLRNETELEINSVLEQAKPYNECNIEESHELRQQLMEKINTLSGLGKVGSIQVFLMHLKDVEFHIETLQMQEKIKAEKAAEKPDFGIGRIKEEHSINARKRAKQREAFGRSRWTVDFDDDGEDDE